MLYVIIGLDKPDHGHIRAANRADHLAYLDSLGDRLRQAGPLIDEEHDAPMGSLLIIDFVDRLAAEAFVAGDPYTQAGLFAQTAIHRFRKVFPQNM